MSIEQRKIQYEYVKHVAYKLGDLVGQVVFVGGATIGFLLTEEGAPDVRETMDVDFIVEILNLADYHVFSKKLRALGFKESQELTCRWSVDNIIVDCMPTDESVLGFTNRWYGEAIRHADSIRLDGSIDVKVISAPYFIATKLEAFSGRGQSDYLGSHDLEDLICIIDGNKEIAQKVINAKPPSLVAYIKEKFSYLLNQSDFIESLPGHLGSYPSGLQYQRKEIVLKRINNILADNIA
tara:strand:- start:6563 stop:7276 length:714 start_codon:yes stop_codon:yes gene_type:complete